jgi:predicted kinase
MSGNLILTIGVPGSGKSHWAQNYQSTNTNVVIIERDLLREELCGSRQDFSKEREVTTTARLRAAEALKAGKTVIIADTNLVAKFRKEWRLLALSFSAGYREVLLDTPFAVCAERNAARPEGKRVPDESMEVFRDRMCRIDAEDFDVVQ